MLSPRQQVISALMRPNPALIAEYHCNEDEEGNDPKHKTENVHALFDRVPFTRFIFSVSQLIMPLRKFVAQSTEPNVGYRYTEEVMPDGEIHFDGDSEEALKMARLISAAGDFNWIAAVCEAELPDEIEWTLFRVVERSDNKGWDLEANAVTGRLWYRERNSAVSYSVDSAKGHIAVVRLIEKDGKLRSLLLIDRR